MACVFSRMPVSQLLWECCGGEKFLAIPGLGSFHVPPAWEFVNVSLALPIVIGMYVAAIVIFWIQLRIGRFKHSLAIALGLAVVLVPTVLNSPIGARIVDTIDNTPSYEDRMNDMKTHLRDSQYRIGDKMIKTGNDQQGPEGVMYKTGFGPNLITNVVITGPEETKIVADNVMRLNDTWYLGLSNSKGIPHLQMGVKYGGIFRAGKWQDALHPKQDAPLMWDTFGDYFERLRQAVTRNTKIHANLNPTMWPPSFLLWIRNFAFAVPSDLHHDSHIPNVMRKDLIRSLAERHPNTPVTCDWDMQHTLIGAIRSPSDAGDSFGVEVWKYSGDKHSCPKEGAAKVECVHKHKVIYKEGTYTMFPSDYYHRSLPWTQTASMDFGLNPRIVLTAFVIPCDVNGNIEWEIIGSMGR